MPTRLITKRPRETVCDGRRGRGRRKEGEREKGKWEERGGRKAGRVKKEVGREGRRKRER